MKILVLLLILGIVLSGCTGLKEKTIWAEKLCGEGNVIRLNNYNILGSCAVDDKIVGIKCFEETKKCYWDTDTIVEK